MIEIDIRKLKLDIERLAAECRALKRVLRSTWTEPMGDAQRALLRARRRLTELHVFAAHRREKLHVLRPPREGWSPGAVWDATAFHTRIAERVANDYAPALATAAAS